MTTVDNFAEEFQSISNKNKTDDIQDNIEVDEFNRFVSVTCPHCKLIKTQHRCLHEISDGFMYDGKSI